MAETPVVVVGGPTAGGKSAIALALATAFGGTVVNADSMQVYHELRVLTARPGPDEEAAAPHRLYGVLPAAEPCSAARWRDLALGAIEEARGQGRLPVVVGGTGLYLRALMEGIADVPPIPAEVRARARALLEGLGPAGLHASLAARDPATAARLAPGDAQRVARAWEVLEATGRPLSAWQAETGGPPAGLAFLRVLVLPPRPVLYANCDRRLLAMIEGGALDEVRALAALGLDPALPATKALGVPELLAHLRGEASLEAAVASAQMQTRRYAKRQTTWFRNQWVRVHACHAESAQDSERVVREIASILREMR
jgi:tRNA dimethylallyltransferase